MKIKLLIILFIPIMLTGCLLPINQDVFNNSPEQNVNNVNNRNIEKQNNNSQEENMDVEIGVETRYASSQETDFMWHMKSVPVEISDADLQKISDMNFKVLSVEWGMDDVEVNDLKIFLDRISKYDLQVILDAGFSEGAWDYCESCKKLTWQKEKVQAWMQNFINSPAVYAWDISNEAGENFLAGGLRISLDQLKTAAVDVHQIDSTRPIIMRMHYWDEYDGNFDAKNPFDKNIVDIVVLNLYSNYSQDGANAFLPNMIQDSAQVLVNKIHKIDPSVQIWISLAVYQELPSFIKPNPQDVERDIVAVQNINGVSSVGFFGWDVDEGEWYLPRDGQELLTVISRVIIK